MRDHPQPLRLAKAQLKKIDADFSAFPLQRRQSAKPDQPAHPAFL